MASKSKRSKRVHEAYARRTGMNTRAAVILAKAVVMKPETIEDPDGNIIRVWKSSESSSYSNADLVSCLRNRVAVEAAEMLGTVPPSAIKYCVTKGWLLPNASGTLFQVTKKAARELDLPVRFKGVFNGRRIPFAG